MQGAIEGLCLPCALSYGDHPLLSAYNQDLSDYRKFYSMGYYTKDLTQRIVVPVFDDYDTVNYFRLGNKSLYYVVGYGTSTDYADSVYYDLSYDAPSSLLHSGDTNVLGVWDRMPARLTALRYAKDNPMTSTLKLSNSVALPTITKRDDDPVFWVQITASVDRYTVGTSVQSKDDTYCSYGCFVRWSGTTMNSPRIRADANDSTIFYPFLSYIINNLDEYFGIQAETVQDISISARCPYAYTYTSSTGVYALNESAPTYLKYETQLGDYVLYNLNWCSNLTPLSETVQFTPSTYSLMYGNIVLHDHAGNSIGEIPTQYFGSATRVTLTTRCIADYSGLTTEIISSLSDELIYRIPEGHLPWVGSAWAQYQAYSMAYDRQAVADSVQYTNERIAVSLAETTVQAAATASGASFFGIGALLASGVSEAAGMTASYLEADITNRETQSTQALTEKRAQGQPGTTYSAGYGLKYCTEHTQHPAYIGCYEPAQLTSTIDTAYRSLYGYNADGQRASIGIQAGYYKGRIASSSLSVQGPKADALNKALSQGMRFVLIT